jgi:hypothetical protein
MMACDGGSVTRPGDPPMQRSCHVDVTRAF